MNVHGLSRPTAMGSDMTRDKNHGVDSNNTLIAEQMGRIPATEHNLTLDIVSLEVWREKPRAELPRRIQTALTVMDRHAVLLPAAALVNPAGVGEGLLISQRGPGEAAQIRSDQADVAPPPVLCGHIDHGVGVGAAHQAAVLTILAVGARDLVGGWKLTVHPDVMLQVC